MSELTGWIGLPQFGVLGGIVLIAGGIKFVVDSYRTLRISNRLFSGENDPAGLPREDVTATAELVPSRLATWLVRAGHHAPNAEATFLAGLIGCTLLAGFLLWGVLAAEIVAESSALIAGLPVVGAGLSSVVAAIPVIAMGALAGLPIWLVRRDRARRVEEIERDLPLVLELLATLAEAGLGFESAVAELLRAQPAGRPLADEFRRYQLEVSAGARRSESLQRLATRVDLASVSSFTSALRHGEETGASISGLLRPQASLVRQRRRERALAAAEALPEKLVVPLLLGFLPGLLVWTLGPAFFQLFEMIDAAFG